MKRRGRPPKRHVDPCDMADEQRREHMRAIAMDLARDSVVTMALARWTEQIIEFVAETVRKQTEEPLLRRIAELEAELAELSDPL